MIMRIPMKPEIVRPRWERYSVLWIGELVHEALSSPIYIVKNNNQGHRKKKRASSILNGSCGVVSPCSVHSSDGTSIVDGCRTLASATRI